jgi:hypothetical protein
VGCSAVGPRIVDHAFRADDAAAADDAAWPRIVPGQIRCGRPQRGADTSDAVAADLVSSAAARTNVGQPERQGPSQLDPMVPGGKIPSSR